MSNPAIIALLTFTLIYTALLFLGGAYVYFRGTVKASPLPPRIERLVNPPPKPAEPEKPIPPAFGCPQCSALHKWKLSKDGQKWECTANNCAFTYAVNHRFGV